MRSRWEGRSLENPAVPITSQAIIDLLAGPQSEAGESITASSAMRVTAVYRSVALLSGTGAGLPLGAFKKDADDNREEVTSKSSFLTDPHPEMTPFEFWELALVHLLLWGNFYAWKQYNGAGSAVLYAYPLMPHKVKPGRAKDGTKVFQVERTVQNPDGTTTTLERVDATTKEVFHIPGLGYDGVAGLSPIEMAMQAVGLSLAAEKLGAKLFKDGTLVSGFLHTDRRLQEDQATALKKRWQQRVAGTGAANQVVVLDSGAQFESLTIPPDDMQFLETRRFEVVEIARLYGIPPFLLMETDRSTSWGSGIEQQNRGMLTYALQPWLNRIAGRVTKELLPRGVFAEHQTAALLKGDTVQRFTAYGMGIKDGWFKRADARRAENLPVDDPELEQYVKPGSSSGAVPPPADPNADPNAADPNATGGPQPNDPTEPPAE